MQNTISLPISLRRKKFPAGVAQIPCRCGANSLPRRHEFPARVTRIPCCGHGNVPRNPQNSGSSGLGEDNPRNFPAAGNFRPPTLPRPLAGAATMLSRDDGDKKPAF
jgi:hypothetical protein